MNMEQEEFDWKSKRKSRADQIFGRFEFFFENNPNVWKLFCKFADEKWRVTNRYSARAVFERVRWEMDFTVNTTDDTLKMNDHLITYYARMYIATHPKAEGFFELRKRTSQDRSAYKNDLSFFHSGKPVDEEWLMQRLKELADNA